MYTTVPIPVYVDEYKLMGKYGSNLKYFTERSGCHYMWLDTHARIVEIWGTPETLPYAISLVKYKIKNLTDVWDPTQYELKLSDRLKRCTNVSCWKRGYKTYYEIDGNEKDSKEVFDMLCTLYPYNPYMTQISKRSSTGILALRFSSCD
jgi:hypothetical protein